MIFQGAQASPKRLRHGYGVHALRMGIPLNMLSKWMGHASIATTAIYGNAVGSEELEIAGRMWGEGWRAGQSLQE
ncbi:tyrosine-type recombinase/integrase [Hoeflea poritis]|uniref:tyrosine-type recombinase/integrase n=1 Tax=Hoeflea poritis TaxID=2993659 RepID=UPI003CCD40FB